MEGEEHTGDILWVIEAGEVSVRSGKSLPLSYVLERRGRITPVFVPPGEPEQALEEKPGSPLPNRRWACMLAASKRRGD